MSAISALRIPAVGTHTATVIFAHGLGDTGAGWAFMAEQFRQSSAHQHVAFVFPNAPSIPITLNSGFRMPGWSDITTLTDIMAAEDEAGMLKSVGVIHKLIGEEVDKGIKSERIVVGGFSQGGAIGLLSGLTSERKLGGILGLSSWLPLRNKIHAMRTDGNAKTRVFLGHGTDDLVVQFEFGKKSYETLHRMKQPVEWHEYRNLQHSASPQELDDVSDWLGKVLPA